MKQRLVASIVAALLGFPLLGQAQSASAQTTPTVRVEWQITVPRAPCGAEKYEFRVFKDALYIFDREHFQLCQYQADKQGFKRYDLWRYREILGGRTNFLPFNNLILFTGGNTDAYHKYSLSENTLSVIETTPKIDPVLNCTRQNSLRSQFFSYIGTGQTALICIHKPIVGASRRFDAAILDLSTQTVISLASFDRSEGGNNPYNRLVGGGDGQIYTQHILYDTFDLPYCSGAPDELVIKRWNSQKSMWDTFHLDEAKLAAGVVGRFKQTNRYCRSELMAVDSKGYLYIDFSWSAQSTLNSDQWGWHSYIVKSDQSGNVVWGLTEKQLGSSAYIHSVTPEGKLIVVDGDGKNPYQVMQVSVNPSESPISKK